MDSKGSQCMVLFLGHGSRAPGAMNGMEMVFDQMMQRYHIPHMMICQMEGLGLDLVSAIGQCYQEGFRDILVLPFFLHSGNHLLFDIPAILADSRKKYPDLHIHQGRHLGADSSLADLAYKRLQESLSDMA